MFSVVACESHHEQAHFGGVGGDPVCGTLAALMQKVELVFRVPPAGFAHLCVIFHAAEAKTLSYRRALTSIRKQKQ